MGLVLRETEYDEFSGITTKYWINPETAAITVERIADVESLLDQNKRMFNENKNFSFMNKDEWGYKIADIPLIIVEKWLKEGVDVFSSDPDMTKKVMRKLQDPDWRYLRTIPGKFV